MRSVVLFFLLLLVSSAALAQDYKKNELGLLIGAEFIPGRNTSAGNSISFGNGVIFSANYARRLAGDNTVLFLEFPFTAAPNHDITTSEGEAIEAVATLYVAPSLRVNFAHNSPISPWVSAGFGYGLYEGSRLLNNDAVNPSRNVSSGAAQFGAGIDIKTGVKFLFPISLRGEVRDFYTTSNPNFGVAVRGGGQHNVVVLGGFVLHF